MNVKKQIFNFIVYEILNENENVQLEDNTNLIDNGIIDSIGIMRLLTYLEEEFEIHVGEDQLIPDNFECVESICSLVEKTLSKN